MQHECFEYEGRMSQLQRLIEIDLPAARNRLKSIVGQIDAYQVELPPEALNRPENLDSKGVI